MGKTKMCEYCGVEEAVKYSKYSNGKFCSRECARGFSTKAKRKDINQTVSEKLTGSGNGDVTKVCPTCGVDFSMTYQHRYRTFCSTKCANGDESVRDKIRKKRNGIFDGSIKPMTNEEVKKSADLNRRLRRDEFDNLNN